MPLNNFSIRQATLADAQQLFDWINDSEVRKMSINSEVVEWKGHIKWLVNKLASPDFKIFILEQNNVPFGQIRYEYTNGEWILDYSIGKPHRGKGLGQLIVELSMPLFSGCTIKAVVKKDNVPSNRIFMNLSFVLYAEEKIKNTDYLIYLKNV